MVHGLAVSQQEPVNCSAGVCCTKPQDQTKYLQSGRTLHSFLFVRYFFWSLCLLALLTFSLIVIIGLREVLVGNS